MAIAEPVLSVPAASRRPVRLPLLALALLLLAAFAADAAWALSGPPPAIDVGVERAVQAVAWGPLAVAFWWLDWLDGLKQLALAVLGLALVAIWNRRAFLLAAWGALSGAVYQVTELLVRRPRPDAHLVHVIRHTTGWAFPSGHLVFYTWFLSILLLALARGRLPGPLYRAGWVLFVALLAVVALSRVYTGEHWPSDVLAGLLLGGGWTLLGLSVRRLSDPVLDA